MLRFWRAVGKISRDGVESVLRTIPDGNKKLNTVKPKAKLLRFSRKYRLLSRLSTSPCEIKEGWVPGKILRGCEAAGDPRPGEILDYDVI